MIKKDEKVLGILGGMGSYATVYTFRRILERFIIRKEWDYPRIVIDNNPKLPSRVRAILYNEHKKEIVDGMCNGIRNLTKCGADIILIPCNTAHYFIGDIRKCITVPVEILDMITLAIKKCKERDYRKIAVLASEGTIVANIYKKHMVDENLSIIYPKKNDFKNIRRIIEDVKQDKVSGETKEIFINQINTFDNIDCVVIGCTELSVMLSLLTDGKKSMFKHPVLDVLEVSIDKVVSILRG